MCVYVCRCNQIYSQSEPHPGQTDKTSVINQRGVEGTQTKEQKSERKEATARTSHSIVYSNRFIPFLRLSCVSQNSVRCQVRLLSPKAGSYLELAYTPNIK